jgi:hypothetical protein
MLGPSCSSECIEFTIDDRAPMGQGRLPGDGENLVAVYLLAKPRGGGEYEDFEKAVQQAIID